MIAYVNYSHVQDMYVHVCPMQSKLCNLQRCWHFLVPGSSRRSFIDFVCADLRFYLVNLNLIHFRASMAEFWRGFGPNLYPPDLRGSQMAELLFCCQKAEAKSHERQALQAWQRQVEDCRESAREVQGRKMQKKQSSHCLFGGEHDSTHLYWNTIHYCTSWYHILNIFYL